jgi:hypothetical protein
MMRDCRGILSCVVLAAALACGCDREGVHAYSIPKEGRSASPSMPAMPADHPPMGAAPMGAASRNAAPARVVAWSVPEGWRTITSDQPMRIATFRAGAGEGVEVTLSAFPGDAGGLLANINRWRGQLGMEPTNEAELAGAIRVSKSTVEGVDVRTLRLVGPKGQDMLGAVVVPGDGQTWFVKATGEPAVISQVSDSFATFAGSLRLEAGAATGTPSADMSGPLPMSTVPPAQQSSIGPRLGSFAPPAHWKPENNTSGILAAAFNATNADGGARITATSLFNDGGGTLANINRWRGQLDLPPVATLESQQKIELAKGSVMVDLQDAAGARRMVTAIVPDGLGGQTWFFKLTGGVKGAETERAAFERFVRSVGLGEH